MGINFKLIDQDPQDPQESWSGRPWAGYAKGADPNDLWNYNRGIWNIGPRASEESIATLSYQGSVLLVAAITGVEEVHEQFNSNGRKKRALQGFVLSEGHPAHDALIGTSIAERIPGNRPGARNPVAYTDTSDLDPFMFQASASPTLEAVEGFPSSGQGRLLDPLRRKALEDAAQTRLERHYRNEGWDVQDVRFEGPYDAIAKKNGQVRYLEAKGTQSSGASVIVTAGEVEFAKSHPGQCVIGILSNVRFAIDGQVDENEATFAVRDWAPHEGELKPIDYRWTPRTT